MNWKPAPKRARVVMVAVRRLRHVHYSLNFTRARRYAKRMQQGHAFPLLECGNSSDGRSILVWNGNHRLFALRRIGVKRIPVILFQDVA